MKKFLNLFILIFILFPVLGFCGNYYVKKIDNQWKYRSGAWLTKSNGIDITDIQEAMDAVDGSAPANTLVVYPGTYSSTDLDASDLLDSAAINLIFRGSDDYLDGDYYAPRGCYL